MEVDEVYIAPDGRPTVRLIADWRRKGALAALQPAMTIVEEGRATPAFRGLWRAAFPTRTPLPLEPISTRDGTFTQLMLDRWS